MTILKYYFVDAERTMQNTTVNGLWPLYYKINIWMSEMVGTYDDTWRWEYIIGKTFPHGLWIDTEEHYFLLRIAFGELAIREALTDYEGADAMRNGYYIDSST